MANKFYFTVFQFPQALGYSNQEWAGDTHPFALREKLIEQGVFKKAVIIFFREISKSEYLMFMDLRKKPRPEGN